MLTEIIRLSLKIKEEMKTTQGEIKKNAQGTNSEGKETRTQINDLEQEEEINIKSEQNEEKIMKKNGETLRNLWENFKYSNIWIIWVLEGQEEEQEIENLFEKLTKENFPSVAKEIGSPGSLESQRSWIQGNTY